MAAVTIHLDIDECIQDCPFCRLLENDSWACVMVDPPRELVKAAVPVPFVTPDKMCPIRSMDNHSTRKVSK